MAERTKKLKFEIAAVANKNGDGTVGYAWSSSDESKVKSSGGTSHALNVKEHEVSRYGLFVALQDLLGELIRGIFHYGTLGDVAEVEFVTGDEQFCDDFAGDGIETEGAMRELWDSAIMDFLMVNQAVRVRMGYTFFISNSPAFQAAREALGDFLDEMARDEEAKPNIAPGVVRCFYAGGWSGLKSDEEPWAAWLGPTGQGRRENEGLKDNIDANYYALIALLHKLFRRRLAGEQFSKAELVGSDEEVMMDLHGTYRLCGGPHEYPRVEAKTERRILMYRTVCAFVDLLKLHGVEVEFGYVFFEHNPAWVQYEHGFSLTVEEALKKYAPEHGEPYLRPLVRWEPEVMSPEAFAKMQAMFKAVEARKTDDGLDDIVPRPPEAQERTA